MADARSVDPKARLGQVGDAWGNLLLPEGELSRDERIRFEGDAESRDFWITRVSAYPLDRAKRLYYYEAVPRWKHPPAS